MYIPEHLSERWEAVSLALGVASVRLTDASKDYYKALEDRVKMSEELKNWQMKTYFGVENYIPQSEA